MHQPFRNLFLLPVTEASGLVASRRYEGVFWTICDSGNPRHLFAIDRTGQLLAEYALDTTVNLDWESIALDDQGNLYVGDVGNNLLLPRRWVLRVAEPDPREAATSEDAPPKVVTIATEKTYYYRFDAAAFDVEGTFVRKRSLYLLSKVREKTALYRLRLEGNAEPQTLAKVCDVPGINIVTGADISADGRRVAVCSYHEVAIFAFGNDGVDAMADKPASRIPFQAAGIESCAWDGDDVVLVSEDRAVYRIRTP